MEEETRRCGETRCKATLGDLRGCREEEEGEATGTWEAITKIGSKVHSTSRTRDGARAATTRCLSGTTNTTFISLPSNSMGAAGNAGDLEL